MFSAITRETTVLQLPVSFSWWYCPFKTGPTLKIICSYRSNLFHSRVDSHLRKWNWRSYFPWKCICEPCTPRPACVNVQPKNSSKKFFLKICTVILQFGRIVHAQTRLCTDACKSEHSHFTSGPGCSKLTRSLVNISLNFQTLISQICQYFSSKIIEKLLQWVLL